MHRRNAGLIEGLRLPRWFHILDNTCDLFRVRDYIPSLYMSFDSPYQYQGLCFSGLH